MQSVAAQQSTIQMCIEKGALAGYEAIEHLRGVRKQVEADVLASIDR